jgi:hypothetical protein
MVSLVRTSTMSWCPQVGQFMVLFTMKGFLPVCQSRL